MRLLQVTCTGIALIFFCKAEQHSRTGRQSSTECFQQIACLREGSNMLRSLVTELPFDRGEASSVTQTCQEACAGTENCKFFTWYEKNGAFPFSCFLYSGCDKTAPCSDCVTGPERCRTEEESQCSPIEDDFGGSWYCFPDVGLFSPVPTGTKCIWQCPGQSSFHECQNGEWSNVPGHSRCMCHKIGDNHPGQVLCYPRHEMNEAVSSGTYCLHTCHGHPKTEMICDRSVWSTSPSSLSCHGGNSSSRFQDVDISQLGSRATEKLKEMRGQAKKDWFMKTKVDGKVLTMKKVVGGLDRLSDRQILRPEPVAADQIVGNLNFFQKLKSTQDSLSKQDDPAAARFRSNPGSVDRQDPPPAPVKPNKPTIITLEIPRQPSSLANAAVFPQQETSFNFRDLIRDGGDDQLFTVSSQLGVSQQTERGNFKPGTVDTIQTGVVSDSEAVKLKKQMEKLEELEKILQSSDDLSPITLEMVENALITLNQKKNARSPDGAQRPLTRAQSLDQLTKAKVLSSAGKIVSKGDAPILVPHPGDHMVPMSDRAIVKQNNLRKLRSEMIKMNKKLAEFEARGINPTRDHVMDHLKVIKDLTFEERPLRNAVRSHRNPVNVNPSHTVIRLTTRAPVRVAPTSANSTDLGDVIEGLVALADRFPQDFSDLMQIEKQKFTDSPIKTQQKKFEMKCVKPADPANGRVLCNSKQLEEGSKCILDCQHGFLPASAEIITCTRGSWTRTVLRCEETLSVLIGGFNSQEGELADVELYSPSGKCDSKQIRPLPSPRRGLVAAYIDGSIIACGGVNNTENLNQCWRYAKQTNSWIEIQPLHRERHFGSIVPASGTLIVLGGRDGSATPMALGGMEQWREGAWHQVNTKMSLERSYQCSTSVARDKLMVTGGYSWNTILGRVESLRMTQGNEWELLAPLQTARYLHSCGSLLLPSGEVGLLVTGGYSQDYLNSTEIYNPKSNTWEFSGETSEPRQGAVVLLVGGKPTIFGGFNDYDKYPTLVEQFDPDIGMWFPLKERLKRGRRYFAGVSVPRSMFPWCKT